MDLSGNQLELFKEYVENEEELYWWEDYHSDISDEEVRQVQSDVKDFLEDEYMELYGVDLDHAPLIPEGNGDVMVAIDPGSVETEMEEVSENLWAYASNEERSHARHELNFELQLVLPRLEDGVLGRARHVICPDSAESIQEGFLYFPSALAVLSSDEESDEVLEFSERTVEQLMKAHKDEEYLAELEKEFLEIRAKGQPTREELSDARQRAVSHIEENLDELTYTEPVEEPLNDFDDDVLMRSTFPTEVSGPEVVEELRKTTTLMQEIAVFDYGLAPSEKGIF